MRQRVTINSSVTANKVCLAYNSSQDWIYRSVKRYTSINCIHRGRESKPDYTRIISTAIKTLCKKQFT